MSAGSDLSRRQRARSTPLPCWLEPATSGFTGVEDSRQIAWRCSSVLTVRHHATTSAAPGDREARRHRRQHRLSAMRHSSPLSSSSKSVRQRGDSSAYRGSAVNHPTPPAAAVSRNTSFRCPPTPPSNPSLDTGQSASKVLITDSYFGAGGADPSAGPRRSARGLSASPRHPCTAAVAWPTARIDRPRPCSGAYHWDAPRGAC
jgi:hypothetical protein